MNIATLNAYQAEQFREWIAEQEADRRAGYLEPDPEGERAAHALQWWPCAVPGMVAVCDARGHCMRLLYPVPRPVPKDPLFQRADGVTRSHRVMSVQFTRGRRDYWFQKEFDHGVHMDAPSEMPAGSTTYFAYDDETYGSHATSFYREE